MLDTTIADSLYHRSGQLMMEAVFFLPQNQNRHKLKLDYKTISLKKFSYKNPHLGGLRIDHYGYLNIF